MAGAAQLQLPDACGGEAAGGASRSLEDGGAVGAGSSAGKDKGVAVQLVRVQLERAQEASQQLVKELVKHMDQMLHDSELQKEEQERLDAQREGEQERARLQREREEEGARVQRERELDKVAAMVTKVAVLEEQVRTTMAVCKTRCKCLPVACWG